MIRASDLIGCVVHTESGQKLGRVHDLRAHADGDGWLLMGVVVGPRGLAARFAGGLDGAPIRAGRVVPWEAITKLEDGSITVLDVVADEPSGG
jgi:sporulation protein YlmC with PRC-barrel domain